MRVKAPFRILIDRRMATGRLFGRILAYAGNGYYLSSPWGADIAWYGDRWSWIKM